MRTGLDRVFLGISVALFRCRYQARIHDLARHGNVSLLVQLPVEGFHHPLQRAGLGQPVAKVPDGVLVRCRGTQVEAKKAHPGEPVADHEFHFGVTRIVLSL